MFNSSLKKECIKELESCIKIYDGVIENTKTSSIKLLDIRMKAVKLIGIVERYINTIANTLLYLIPPTYPQAYPNSSNQYIFQRFISTLFQIFYLLYK